MKPIHQFSPLLAKVGLLVILASCADRVPIWGNPTLPPVTSAEMTNPVQVAQQDIWTQMRQGKGYVVLLRHAQTTIGTGDPPGFRLNDCATQRNLSAAGKKQAVRIGQEFSDRQIPIRQVLSSQYCRCLETARLLELGTVKPSPMLNSIFEDRQTATQQTAQVRQQILNHRNTAGVVVMVSHAVNIIDLSCISPQSGDGVVMKANQQGKIEVVGQIQNL